MIKRIITPVIIAGLFSAGLLFLGLTVLGQYSPARASSLDALVARTTEQNSPNLIPVGKSSPVTANIDSGKERSAVSSPSVAVSAIPAVSTEIPVAGVTIAQMLNNPDKFVNQKISLTGYATSLAKDKFLLNDGTGQILVEVEDDLVGFAIIDGMSITVLGRVDHSSSQSGIVLDAQRLTDKNGNIYSDDCLEDDSSTGDDCIDEIDDDCLDDSDDDMDDSNDDSDDASDDDIGDDSNDDDDDATDDDSDDGSDDDSNDDSNDDSGEDGEDD